jgi:hypothetical protein
VDVSQGYPKGAPRQLPFLPSPKGGKGKKGKIYCLFWLILPFYLFDEKGKKGKMFHRESRD